jgi:hypothetical protein
MHIKKFTQFIVENDHYSSINEADIVPGVPFNSTGGLRPSGTMTVDAKPEGTEIKFYKNAGEDDEDRVIVYLCFPPSKKPTSIYNGQISAYAYVEVFKNGGQNYPAASTKMDDFDANKSAKPLFRGANSIDLLAEFMTSAGIVRDAKAGTNLAKVIAILLLNPTFKDNATDTFIKFANNIITNVRNQGFIIRMSDEYVTVKQSPGMKAFGTELLKSYDTLSKPKTADAAKK